VTTDVAERDPALPGAPQRVLFVCTHNSARSIMAEALLRQRGGDRYQAWSAGTHPGEVRALTLRVLQEAGLPTDELRSEPVEAYLDRRFDHVVTVCDSAREECPVFPGSGQRLHWSFEDPSAATGSEEQRLAAFGRVFDAIAARIDEFVS
jgi:arsenate reductase